jgi:hypothetical protein
MMDGPLIIPNQNRNDPDFLPFINLVRYIKGTCPTINARKIGRTILKITANKNSWSRALNRKVIV